MAVSTYRAHRYCCDECGAIHEQQTDAGYYTNSTPPQWGRLKHGRSGYNDADLLLCESCYDAVVVALSSRAVRLVGGA